MSRYELCCPPVRQWPAMAKSNFIRLYDTAMDRVIPWRWMCSVSLLPGSPAYKAIVDMREAAREV